MLRIRCCSTHEGCWSVVAVAVNVLQAHFHSIPLWSQTLCLDPGGEQRSQIQTFRIHHPLGCVSGWPLTYGPQSQDRPIRDHQDGWEWDELMEKVLPLVYEVRNTGALILLCGESTYAKEVPRAGSKWNECWWQACPYQAWSRPLWPQNWRRPCSCHSSCPWAAPVTCQ